MCFGAGERVSRFQQYFNRITTLSECGRVPVLEGNGTVLHPVILFRQRVDQSKMHSVNLSAKQGADKSRKYKCFPSVFKPGKDVTTLLLVALISILNTVSNCSAQ